MGLRQLARNTGVAHGTLYELEHGKRGAYKSTVRKLAEALGCEPWELTGLNPWELSEKERQALSRLLESGRPQSLFDEDEDE